MGMARAESKNVHPAVSRLPKPRRDACRRENSETQDRTGDLQIFSLTLSQVSSRGLALASARGRELELIQFFSERARQGASFSGLFGRVHSSVVRAADCRSAGPWFKSGCALSVCLAAHGCGPLDKPAVLPYS